MKRDEQDETEALDWDSLDWHSMSAVERDEKLLAAITELRKYPEQYQWLLADLKAHPPIFPFCLPGSEDEDDEDER